MIFDLDELAESEKVGIAQSLVIPTKFKERMNS
jgi:hypothetical protein